jgi:hypothetical protein
MERLTEQGASLNPSFFPSRSGSFLVGGRHASSLKNQMKVQRLKKVRRERLKRAAELAG